MRRPLQTVVRGVADPDGATHTVSQTHHPASKNAAPDYPHILTSRSPPTVTLSGYRLPRGSLSMRFLWTA